MNLDPSDEGISETWGYLDLRILKIKKATVDVLKKSRRMFPKGVL